MKRLLITLVIFIIAVPILLAGALYLVWKTTSEEVVPTPTLSANGVEVPLAGHEWHVALFGGVMYKDFEEKTTLEATNVGEITASQVGINFPEGYESRVCVLLDGEKLWDGTQKEYQDFVITQGGSYVVQVDSSMAKQKYKSWGDFVFRFSFNVKLEPELSVSSDRVAQGDVLAIRVDNVSEEYIPSASGSIGPITFTDSGGGSMTAYVPIMHNREPGAYTISVGAGWYSWDVSFTVTETDFGIQNLDIDTSNPTISEANSPAAYQQYRDKIYPVFEMIDENQYWEGMFACPVEPDSRISTNYGLARYTNGAMTSTPHNGMDFAVPEGTPVWAPNNGVVVFSENLLNTGNTIVIEHGGGLKTYYFHLSERFVEEGDMVTLGDTIAAVGTTGYSTGPHLHYEVRIGDQSIDPAVMFEPSSGFYAFVE